MSTHSPWASCDPVEGFVRNGCISRNVARKSSIGGFTFVQGLDIENLMKTPLIYSIPYFNLGGLVLF